jgi:hypothetical protein
VSPEDAEIVDGAAALAAAGFLPRPLPAPFPAELLFPAVLRAGFAFVAAARAEDVFLSVLFPAVFLGDDFPTGLPAEALPAGFPGEAFPGRLPRFAVVLPEEVLPAPAGEGFLPGREVPADAFEAAGLRPLTALVPEVPELLRAARVFPVALPPADLETLVFTEAGVLRIVRVDFPVIFFTAGANTISASFLALDIALPRILEASFIDFLIFFESLLMVSSREDTTSVSLETRSERRSFLEVCFIQIFRI